MAAAVAMDSSFASSSNMRMHVWPECVDTDETRALLGALTHADYLALHEQCKLAYDKQVVRPLAVLLAPLAAAATKAHESEAAAAPIGKKASHDTALTCDPLDVADLLLDDDALATSLGMYALETHYHSQVMRQCASVVVGVGARPDEVTLQCVDEDDAAAIEGDDVHAQLDSDYFENWEPHDGQVALYETIKQMMGARIYGIRNWKRNWRAICRRNAWHDTKLRLGLASAEMPRRFGKTTGSGRATLALAMNISYFRACIISLDFDTACIMINEVYEQMQRHRRFMRDFHYRYCKGCIVIWPRSDPRDLRVIFAIPGLVSSSGVWRSGACSCREGRGPGRHVSFSHARNRAAGHRLGHFAQHDKYTRSAARIGLGHVKLCRTRNFDRFRTAASCRPGNRFCASLNELTRRDIFRRGGPNSQNFYRASQKKQITFKFKFKIKPCLMAAVATAAISTHDSTRLYRAMDTALQEFGRAPIDLTRESKWVENDFVFQISKLTDEQRQTFKQRIVTLMGIPDEIFAEAELANFKL